jgi:hypothetical protein
MRPTGCPETSVQNYHSTLHSNPEDRASRNRCLPSSKILKYNNNNNNNNNNSTFWRQPSGAYATRLVHPRLTPRRVEEIFSCPHLPRPVLVPIQPPVRCVLDRLPGIKRDVALTAHRHLAPRSRMGRTLPPRPLCASTDMLGSDLYLYVSEIGSAPLFRLVSKTQHYTQLFTFFLSWSFHGKPTQPRKKVKPDHSRLT